MQEVHLQYLGTADEQRNVPTGIALTHFPCVVGRHPKCDYRLADPAVSRRHCSCFMRGGEVWVQDLGSENGTYVNGQRLTQAQPLHDGDQLTFAHRTFEVHMPGLPGAAAEKTDAAGTAAGRPQNVLVVEDNVDAAETLALLLKEWGHEVHVANDGQEAIQAARIHQPDTVLLDMRLPRLDGYQVARQLREQPGLKKARLVAITGYEEEARRRSQELGIARVLTKPVDLTTLQEVLSQSA